jgi:hypothetical protein
MDLGHVAISAWQTKGMTTCLMLLATNHTECSIESSVGPCLAHGLLTTSQISDQHRYAKSFEVDSKDLPLFGMPSFDMAKPFSSLAIVAGLCR